MANEIQNLCQNNVRNRVHLRTNDGQQLEAVILDVDDEYLYLVVPANQLQNMNRFFGPGGYGYGYGAPHGYGLQRLILPLTFIAALSVLPW
ncbi:hypothetical protein [Halalkalibacillus halophilus]|uniref:hypothetical protein n=1 Tax=Halalkalibacillus halophilus TaxID=392827 RepID=UPI00042A814F|nr:hypothetical protein [Halalkalibacillus halophilus]